MNIVTELNQLKKKGIFFSSRFELWEKVQKELNDLIPTAPAKTFSYEQALLWIECHKNLCKEGGEGKKDTIKERKIQYTNID